MIPAEEQTDRSRRFANIWVTSRADAGKTQAEMADGLGISRKTVQNWESGVTAPDLFTGCEWFRFLGLNPLPYYLAYLFPEFFDGVAPEENDEALSNALMEIVSNMKVEEKRQLLYLMAGRHGSPWYSLLQMFTAHCHTSMRSRVNVARAVLDNYEMEARTGDLVCPDNIGPDLELLRESIEQGKKAAMDRSSAYKPILNKDK